jgi:multidrug resistance efflux pump
MTARHLLHARGTSEPPFYRRLGFLSVVAILLLAVSAIAARYWLLASDRQSTDRAFIEAAAGEAGHLSVVANFKRTQLVSIRPGQSAMITLPAYPDEVLRGRVDAIDERASVRGRSLRVPVRIVVDQPPEGRHLLGPGMPVVATVIVR